MRPSLYNLFIPTTTGKYILYNTLRDTILLVDAELKEALEKDSPLPEQARSILKQMGMVVDLPEAKVYQYLYYARKYGVPGTLFVVFPTYACNLACPYCYEKAGTVLSHSMDAETAENTAAFMQKMIEENRSPTVLLKFYGGEPLVNTDAVFTIADRLSAYTEKNSIGLYIILQTNGTLLNADVVEKLSPHLSGVEMTLEGDKELHDTIRTYKKGGGTYEDIMKSVQFLLLKNIHTTLRVNVSEAHHLDALLKDLKARGIQGTNFSFYMTQTSDFGLKEFFTDDMLCFHDEKKALDLIPALRAVVEENGYKENLTTFDTLQRQKIVSCASERRGRYVVDPFGDVYLCFFTAGQKEHSIGTVGKGGAITWNANFYEVMARNPLEFAECRECVVLPMCGGGCHIRAHHQKGTYLAPHCESVKELAGERIKLYLRQKYPDRFGGLL